MNIEFTKAIKQEIDNLLVVETLNDVDKLQKLAALMNINKSLMQEQVYTRQSKMFDEINESMKGLNKEDLKDMFGSMIKGMS